MIHEFQAKFLLFKHVFTGCTQYMHWIVQWLDKYGSETRANKILNIHIDDKKSEVAVEECGLALLELHFLGTC